MNRYISLGIAMLAGAAIGAAAVGGLHAQGKPKAYLVTELQVLDAAATAAYGPKVQATQKAAGGRVAGVDEVVGSGHEVTVHADNGAAVMSPVALALHAAGTTVASLTLRTPTLDDVFLQLTGTHLQDGATSEGSERSSEHAEQPEHPEKLDRESATEGART